MTIPSGSNFPTSFDDDSNLFLVHDALRMVLAEDYVPGDTSISVDGDAEVMAKFPTNGYITLIDQCNEPTLRALSFYYGSRTNTTFDELEIRDGYTDVGKPKGQTNIIQNVDAEHHNAIKDACIAIEQYIGVKGTIDTVPNGNTLVGRLNYLRKLSLAPKAWFSGNVKVGIVPVTLTVVDESFRNPNSWHWDFGDGSGSISSISSISSSGDGYGELTEVIDGAVPCGSISAPTIAERTFTHTYYTPGKYDISLTVGNEFGRDTVVFEDFFIARAPAPEEAEFLISPSKVRTNQLVTIDVSENGEQHDEGGDSIDPISQYTWKLGDDLSHASLAEAVALYSVGGIYDVKLRVDTELGAYRITTLENAINVVEQVNLYLMAFDSPKTTYSVNKNLKTYEFGLISESFKSDVMPELTVSRDYTFMSGYDHEDYQRDLFLRNVSFAPSGTVASGDNGFGILYWASDSTTIDFKKFKPFAETWTAPGFSGSDSQTRNWNWLGVNSLDNIFILFGVDAIEEAPGGISLSKTQNDLGDLSTTSSSYTSANFINGADELLELADNAPATYKSCFQGSNGFFARNDAGPGGFFRIRSFYRTEGSLSDVATDIRKLPDIPGTARTNLEMVPLATGIFIFNNSGEVAAYNPTTNVWTTGGPGIGSASFRDLQDSSVDGYSELDQTLLATSDGDRKAYLSYDYSDSAFIKFNEADLTFTSLAVRPTSNEQFVITVF